MSTYEKNTPHMRSYGAPAHLQLKQATTMQENMQIYGIKEPKKTTDLQS